MSRRFVIRKAARRDIRIARKWYDDQTLGLGDRFFLELLRVFRDIHANPLSFPEVRSGARRAVLKKFPYSVFYLVDDFSIVVVVVVHHSRDDDSWESRLDKELGRENDEPDD